jgi:S-adenosyl-L-methionine hydrolase (adenosine-forming)
VGDDASMTRSIVFLSDFGFRNEWVGVCHAVIDKVAPGCPVVDLSHGIPPLDVPAGALLLADSLAFIRHDAIALAVVDPSVGRDRDIAVEADDGRLFVGPDNGLLSPAWRVAGGVRNAVSITSSSVLLEPVSASFHARDVLAPAAAHLALGAPLADLGPAIAAETLAEVRLAEPLVEPGKITCEVQDLNRFGNIQLNVRSSQLVAAGLDRAERILVETPSGGGAVARTVVTYADLPSGEWGLMVDPRGWLSVICGNPVNAAQSLGVAGGEVVWLSADRGQSG